MKTTNNKKGFTIIEVVLVLAIAGLIFMMVFLALPALQRSQRDTERSNVIARMVTALNNYQANNRGAIPTEGTYVIGHATPFSEAAGSGESGEGGSGGSSSAKASSKSWEYFYDKYLIVSSAGSHDTFSDPDGTPFSLWVMECMKETGTVKSETRCTNTNSQRSEITFDVQSGGLDDESNAATAAKPDPEGLGGSHHSIAVVKHAACQGEDVYYSSGARRIALVYKKEGGGTICLNN